MYAKRCDASKLPDRRQRLLVLYAEAANHDCWAGGMRADVRADRSFLGREAQDVVAQVYARSSGRVPDQLGAWECGECGQAHYGREAAEACCQPCEWEECEEEQEEEQ